MICDEIDCGGVSAYTIVSTRCSGPFAELSPPLVSTGLSALERTKRRAIMANSLIDTFMDYDFVSVKPHLWTQDADIN